MAKRKPHPKQSQLKDVFSYDSESGALTWLGGPRYGEEAGYRHPNGYRYIVLNGELYLTHNLVWIWNKGELPVDAEVDHKDRVKLNNRISDLRSADKRQQGINKRVQGFCRSGRKKHLWQARHRLEGKNIHIGQYPTALQARLAYERHTSGLEPEFASTFFTDAFNRLIAA